MSEAVASIKELHAEIEDLRARLAESEQIVEAIRSGAVDGIVVSGSDGEQVYTLQGADHTYRTLIEQMGEGAATINQDGHILYAKQALCRLLNRDPAVLLGASIYDYVEENQRPALQATFQMNRGDGATVNLALATSDVSRVPVMMNSAHVQIDDSVVFCVVFADLTEQEHRANELEQAVAARTRELVRANQALRASEEKYRLLFDNAEVLVSIYDKNGKCLLMNKRVAENFGGLPAEFIGKSVRELHPEKGDEYTARIREVIETGASREYEDFVQFSLGPRWLLSNVQPIEDAHGHVVAAQIISQDITQRKQADRKIQDLAKFPSENPHPVMRIARDGTVMYANQAAQPLLQQHGVEVGMAAPQDWCQSISQAFAADSTETLELTHGSRIFSFAIAPVGEAGYINWYGRDVTEHKQAEQAAREAQERLLVEQRMARERAEAELEKLRDELVRKARLAAIGQVSATIAHEVRNPLGSIRNAVFRLKRKTPSDPPFIREYLGIIDDEVARADAIITNLLSMARAKAPETQDADFGQIVADVLARNPERAQLRCELSLNPDPFPVCADPYQLSQIVQILLDNAAAAMDGHGEVFMEAHRNGEIDAITFRDSGPGVPTEVRRTLFEPLVTTKAQGTGLGLTICQQMIELHGGTIELIEHDAGGAAFRIRLPRSSGETPNEQ